MPVEFGIGAAPCCAIAKLVAQVRAHHPALVPVAVSDRLPVGQPVGLGVFGVVPKAVVVGLAATPVGMAHVVIEDNHDACACQGLDHGVHDLHGVLAFELGIGGDCVIGR